MSREEVTALANAGSAAEGQDQDLKSLRLVSGKTADWNELARDCVCFANGSGGRIVIGIEDDQDDPPPDQRIDPRLLDKIRKRVGELTVNVQATPQVQTAENGGEVVILAVQRSIGVASTSDGRYFLRVGDMCRPLVGDEVMRLADERPGTPWETMVSARVPRASVDRGRLSAWKKALQASDRVKPSVKEKAADELLEHYALARDDELTNLGILLFGAPQDRAKLGTAPVVQAIRYDAHGGKVDKFVWDDYALSPVELLDAVWQQVPDFRESYELPDGMFREKVPAYDGAVVRELLVNALVHRPYTQRGDIFLNLHPDRLEVVNPGRLPLGVTPENILQQSRRRNDGLARVFHDLKLMEREGSGFDLMYDRLLASGRAAPVVEEGIDSVHVTVERRVIHPGVIRLIGEADQRYQLSQRERIALGLLGQSEGLAAADLVKRLALRDASALRPWIARLLELGLVEQAGRTRATRYFVPPPLLRDAGLDGQTTLARIEPHRLEALILQDLTRYPDSPASDIHRRIGQDVPERTFRRTLRSLVDDGTLEAVGERRWRRYRVATPIGQEEG